MENRVAAQFLELAVGFVLRSMGRIDRRNPVNDYPYSGWLYWAAKGREIKSNVGSCVYVWNPGSNTGVVFKKWSQ
jgi:hypothetical protein